MTQTIPVVPSHLDSPRVRIVTMDHPWQWLMTGWRATLKTPIASLFYGVIFVVVGYFLTATVSQQFHLALALATSFMLMGPFLAMGIYDLSRQLDAGKPVNLASSLFAWRDNLMAVLLFGIILGLIAVLWVRLSGVLFAFLVSGQEITVDTEIAAIFFTGSGLTFLVTFLVIGLILGTVIFSISVVSIPMLLDRKIDFIMAVQTSLTAVRVNPGPLALWAALILVFTMVGLMPGYLGLAVTMPLIGHASWAAYRDLVEPEK